MQHTKQISSDENGQVWVNQWIVPVSVTYCDIIVQFCQMLLLLKNWKKCTEDFCISFLKTVCEFRIILKQKRFLGSTPILIWSNVVQLAFFFNFCYYLITVDWLFSPPSTPLQRKPPPSPTSTLPLDFVHMSFIVVPVIPSPHCPHPTPPWLLLDCS